MITLYCVLEGNPEKTILNASIIRIACPNYKSLFAFFLAGRRGKNHLLLSYKIFWAKNRPEVPHPQSFRHCPGKNSFNIGIQSWQYIKVNILERKCQEIDFNPWPEAKQIKPILGCRSNKFIFSSFA